MREEFVQFVESPGRETYLAFREKIIASDAYQPYSDELNTAGELYEQGKVKEAQEALQEAMPNLMLSARAHQLLGFLNHKLGDEQAAEAEMMMASACIAGILETGDGSENNPYLVVRTSDEYDVIECMEKDVERQSLIEKDDKRFDVLRCTDGSEYWFDITDPYNQISKMFDR